MEISVTVVTAIAIWPPNPKRSVHVIGSPSWLGKCRPSNYAGAAVFGLSFGTQWLRKLRRTRWA